MRPSLNGGAQDSTAAGISPLGRIPEAARRRGAAVRAQARGALKVMQQPV